LSLNFVLVVIHLINKAHINGKKKNYAVFFILRSVTVQKYYIYVFVGNLSVTVQKYSIYVFVGNLSGFLDVVFCFIVYGGLPLILVVKFVTLPLLTLLFYVGTQKKTVIRFIMK
jgi:hypothetical protein